MYTPNISTTGRMGLTVNIEGEYERELVSHIHVHPGISTKKNTNDIKQDLK